MKKTNDFMHYPIFISIFVFVLLQFVTTFIFASTLYNVLFSILIGVISLLGFELYKKESEYALFGIIFGTFWGCISLWAHYTIPVEEAKSLFLSFFVPFIFMFIFTCSLQFVSNVFQSVIFMQPPTKNES